LYLFSGLNVNIKVIYSFSNKVFMWIDYINFKMIILKLREEVPWMVGMTVLEASPSLPTAAFPSGLC
jgi:hypothetical protein